MAVQIIDAAAPQQRAISHCTTEIATLLGSFSHFTSCPGRVRCFPTASVAWSRQCLVELAFEHQCEEIARDARDDERLVLRMQYPSKPQGYIGPEAGSGGNAG